MQLDLHFTLCLVETVFFPSYVFYDIIYKGKKSADHDSLASCQKPAGLGFLKLILMHAIFCNE